MTRCAGCLLLVAFILSACTERERPDPTGPGTPISLTVAVLAPASSETVRAGTIIPVRVRGAERGLRLNRVGFVARRFPSNTTLDSVAVDFAARGDTTHTFEYRIPADLPTNTQIDFTGIAYSGSSSLRSVPISVIVIACPAGQTTCGQ